MSRALANLLLGSMRKMNLVLVALNLGSRGFGKLGDERRRRDLSHFVLFFLLGFGVAVFLLYTKAAFTLIIIITENHPSISLLHAQSNHVRILQANLNQNKNFPASPCRITPLFFQRGYGVPR